MKTETVTQKPDHELARDEARELFASITGLTVSISAPFAGVDDKEWPHIAYTLTFSRNGWNLAETYKLGVGHVDWRKHKFAAFPLPPADIENMIRAKQRKPSANFKDKHLEARAAAYLAKQQKVFPSGFEVLACLCSDGVSAHSESFSDWASSFGYDSDSIKAKKIYDHCLNLYHSVVSLIGPVNVAKFAELNCRF